MFEAIRSKLIGAWRELRSRGLVTLFFFELVVVTLGVLLAQGIAEWSDERDQFAEMESARARADLEMGDAALVAQAWKDLGKCLSAELDTLLRAASSGEPIDPSLFRRPDIFTLTVMPLSEQTKLLIRERYGDEGAYRYDRMQRLAYRFDARAEEFSDLWSRLALIDPQYGKVGSDDRQFVREVAIVLRANLTTIDAIAGNIIEMAERMELEPKILGEPVRLARNCEEYRDFGRDFATP